MYKILIIDDEILIRELIKKSIDFNALGFEIVGEAKDGRQAMEMIEALHPNLLLLDINIPIINGITLAQSVNKEYPEIQIIILTGYSQFDYAKGAIEAGVLDYLLKPLNNSEFIKALSKAKDVLSNQNQIKKTISDYQNQKLRLDKKELLLKLIESSENYNSLDLYPLTQTGIRPDTGTFQIATILIDRLEELFAPQLEKELWKFAISNIAQEILETSFTSILFQDFDNHIVVLTALDNADSVKVFATSCHHICHAVQKTLNFNTLSLSKIANALFVNSSYLSHLFKQESGSNLSDYLTRVRLDKAKRLLDDNQAQYSLSSIAGMVGYKDEYYFNKCFKKLYGISPKKYVEHK